MPQQSEEEAASIAPDDYVVGSAFITGSYVGSIAKARAFVNGTSQAWGGTFADGTYSYYIGAGKIADGDTVYIKGYNTDDIAVTDAVQVPVITA